MRNLEETFTYDSQNRLTGVWLGAAQTGATAYDGYGRMTAKTADGLPIFSDAVFNTTAKPHAMDAAATVAGVFPATPQTVTYTGFDKVAKVKQGNNSIRYDFGLVNMNGRMYDPVVSSFLSVDQYVQSPENAQGFNRYAYCMNNPLRYVDPSGWLAGAGYTGYTPNSSANAFDPYMFYGGRIPLEPRDLGLRELSTADPIITWMEENSLHGGGGGNVGISTSEQGNDVKYIFGYGDPNPIKVKGEGACLFASLGMICKRLNHWDLDPSFWKSQEELFFSEVEQHGYDSKYLEDFIQWVGEKII